MFKSLVLILAVFLSGCSTVAAFYDSQDPCITTKYPGNTPEERAARMPKWCGATASRQNIYVKSRITDPIGSPMMYYK